MPLKRRKRLKRKDGKEKLEREEIDEETLTTKNEAMDGESLARSEA